HRLAVGHLRGLAVLQRDTAAVQRGSEQGEDHRQALQGITVVVPRQPVSRRRWITALVVLAITVGFGFVAFSFTGLVADAWDVLMDMNLWWIGTALGCVFIAYCFRALHMRVVSGTWRAAPVRTALVFFGLGNLLPAAPLEGFVLVRAALQRR